MHCMSGPRSSLLLLPILVLLVNNNCTTTFASHSCNEKCGNLSIEYPFGITSGCFFPGFQLTCNDNKTYIFDSSNPSTEVLSLNISSGQLRVSSPNASVNNSCDQGQERFYWHSSHIYLPEKGPFTISSTSNKLVAVGCNTRALACEKNLTSSSGCFSTCSKESNIMSGPCNGVGCCEGRPPMGERAMRLAVSTAFDLVNGFPDCSKAFIVEEGVYAFNSSDVPKTENDAMPDTQRMAFVLDWSIPESNCGGLCTENTNCTRSANSTGYLCFCLPGYSGNPYVSGGCQDIDECNPNNPIKNKCSVTARCDNRSPGYKCTCPFGSIGDGIENGSRCNDMVPLIGSLGGLLLLFVCGLWVYWTLRKRKLLRLKEEYFKKNGGLLLRHKISSSSYDRSGHSKIFSAEELQNATNNYHENNILGSGGYGTVYKGILQDETIVAIKKSKVIDQAQLDQFINEVIILSQINHRNVVKLLGCCLETEVPLLVYEFISYGTLYQHVHERENPALRISWPNRLRIARETAEALAYLHSAASIPIYHRDVKSTNILLDANLTAKVSDFGASRLVPFDEIQVATVVQGTLGYLDPEYLQTSELTEKSDVYSFGVVLVELLTGEKPVSVQRPKESINLATNFHLSMNKNELNKMLDKDVCREGTIQVLQAVAELAQRCLQWKGENRPTMKEVAKELALIDGNVVVQHHTWKDKKEENENLLTIHEVGCSFELDENDSETQYRYHPHHC